MPIDLRVIWEFGKHEEVNDIKLPSGMTIKGLLVTGRPYDSYLPREQFFFMNR